MKSKQKKKKQIQLNSAATNSLDERSHLGATVAYE